MSRKAPKARIVPDLSWAVCRVSTDKQAGKGHSLGDQVADARKKAAADGMRLSDHRVYRGEGESASGTIWPTLRRMLGDLEAACERPSVIYLTSLDRLARNMGYQGEVLDRIERCGCTVRFLDQPGIDLSTPEGKLQANLLGSFAQHFTDTLKVRMRKAARAAKDDGRWARPPLTGYRSGVVRGVPEIHPVTGPMVRDSFEAVARGGSKREACERLKAQGVPVPYATFCKLLTNRFYLGEFSDSAPGRWPALVSREVFDTINGTALTDPRKAPKAKSDEMFPLWGHAFCGACGGKLVPSRSRSKTGKRYLYYECGERPRSAECKRIRIPSEEMHERFEKLLARVRFLSDPSTWRDDIRAACEASSAMVRVRVREKEDELTGLERQQFEAAAAFREARSAGLRDLLTRDFEQRATRITEVRRQLAECNLELATLAEDTAREVELVQRIMRAPERLWTQGDLEDRKALCRALFPEGVTLLSTPTGRKLQTPVTTPVVGLISAEKARSYEVVGTTMTADSEVASLSCLNWNQLEGWLRAVDGLRQAA